MQMNNKWFHKTAGASTYTDEKTELPSRETVAAMLKAERIARDPDNRGYADVEEAMRELKKKCGHGFNGNCVSA